MTGGDFRGLHSKRETFGDRYLCFIRLPQGFPFLREVKEPNQAHFPRVPIPELPTE